MDDGSRQLVEWRNLAEAMPGGVAIQRDGRLAFVSSTAAEILGADADALVGERWQRLFVTKDHDELADALDTVRAGEEWDGVATTSGAVGDCRTVAVTLSATPAGAVVWVVTEPATAAQSGTSDLRRYETILDALEDGVYALNEDLEFTYANDGLVELAETPREELLGTSVLDLFPDEEEHEIAAQIREEVVSGDASGGTMEGTLPTSQGKRQVETRFRLYPEGEEEFKGSVGVLRDVTGVRRFHEELREEHQFLQNVVDTLEDVLYVVDEDGDFVFWNDLALERFGYTDEEFARIHPLEFISPPDGPSLPREAFDITEMGDRHTRDLYTKDGEAIPHELRGKTYEDAETGEYYRVGVARDITDRLERQRELERQHDELATLDRINELILRTVQELLTSANREAVEQAVCDRLASSDLYTFAWVGEPELDGDRILPRAVAGEDEGYLEAVTITDDDSETGRGPIGKAMRTRAVQVANVDDESFDPWRGAARERGVESVLAVPLRYEETVYGVLAVYANREDAFSARERDGFDVLGRTVGFVVHATRSQELFFADRSVELEFALASTESIFGNAASSLDCALELAGYVATDERWILYVAVEDVDPTDVVAYAEKDPTVDRARVIRVTADGGRLEVVVARSDLLETVTAAGATVEELIASPDGARLVVRAPGGADVRDIVEIVTRTYDSADLRARRETDSGITAPTRPDGILGDLTERQRNALETAYRAGYFDWPRESTAEEVADSLAVAPATLHGHLRKAEKNVIQALLEKD